MTKLKTGVIGYGVVGKRRANILKQHEKFDFNCIADIQDTTDRSLDGLRQYKSHKEMIKQNNLDSVFVCVPHTTTTEIVVDCLKKGIDVFAGKPPGVCLDDVERMKQVKNNNILQFGFNHRYYQHVQFLKK